jgi:hypothetical protein
MHRKFERLFVWTAAEVLFVAGLIIWLTSLKHVLVLDHPDPIFPVANRTMFRLIGSLALLSAGYALTSRNRGRTVLLIGWEATTVLSYLLGLVWMGEANLLSYIGNMDDLPIAPDFLGPLIFVILGCMVGGSGCLLFWEWEAGRKLARGNAPDELRTSWKIEPGKTKGEGEVGT